jgi:ATP-dependent Clp protease adaptor protein ClpS
MSVDNVIEKATKSTEKIKEPKKFKVVFCNDDITPVEFVILLLMRIFKHDEVSAHEITMQVHHKGSAVAGVYSYEIAEQKGIEATSLARTNEFPLIIKVESE